jgi:photosystem II stability/assembly factor-like uncharacterized protein
MKTKTLLILLIFFAVSSGNAQYVYNWFPSQSGTTNSLNFVNNNFCGGSNGTILHTNNSGLNWSPQSSGTTANLFGITLPTTTLIMISGSNGTILKTTDNGSTWQQVSSGTSSSLYSVSRYYSSIYGAVGSGGTIICSSNSGLNWSQQQSPTANDLKSISCFAFYGWAVGSNSTLIRTTNSGTNWNIIPLGSGLNLNSVSFVNQYTGWLCGDNGIILKSTNSGLNWAPQQSNTTSNLKSAFFIGTSGGYVCGSNGTVLRTTDGGLNWISQTGLSGTNLNAVVFSSFETGIAVGDGGNIFVRRIDSLALPYRTFRPNNIWTWIHFGGTFNQDYTSNNAPGFQWPGGTGKFAIFTTGLNIAAKINGNLRMAAASYSGEYYPGYVGDSSGYKVGKTDSRFRIYVIKRGDNASNSSDWANWGVMVPFGAPFVDVNHSGTYEPNVDTPGVKGASQTNFVCLTDGFIGRHTQYEGFSGGTLPVYAEVHLTAWGYDNPGYEDMQFLKFEIINKNSSAWNNTYMAIYCDPDLGDANDDYIGCDTVRNLGYCYNADNQDGTGSGITYGANPPAVGFKMLNCISSPGLTMKSFCPIYCVSCGEPECENDPSTPEQAYNYMKGLKRDETPRVIPNTNPPQITKFCYSGDPETSAGWTEYGGKIDNCNHQLTGEYVFPVTPGDRRFLMSTGSENFTVNPGDTQRVVMSQLIARGSSNKNSVTLLKQLSDVAQKLCDSGFVIGVNQISTKVPGVFKLYQNYPNPFNPVTNIKYEVPLRSKVKLTIYDVNGREVAVLLDEVQNAGTYSADWDAGNFSSGVYFYVLKAGDYSESKKMVLIK